MNPTDVLLTIDLEFSSGGYLDDPKANRPVGSRCVDLVVNGQSNGLELMLDILDRHGVKATFFVETAQALYFGLEPMGRHVQALLNLGHDVQLHLHPQWIFCQQMKSGQKVSGTNITDSMARLPSSQIAALIGQGMETLDAWGVPKPIALRTGNLQVNMEIYKVMADAGLTLGSNIGLGVFEPEEAALQKFNGRHKIGGVLEVPVFSYRAFHFGRLSRTKTLTITGASAPECSCILTFARNAAVQEVVVLTHAHEMIKRDSARYRSIAPNRINQSRLQKLCRFVCENGENFRFSTFSERAPEWLRQPESPSVTLNAPISVSLLSIAQNRINDSIQFP